MSKVDDLVHKYHECPEGALESALDEILEWAAQQVESDGRQWTGEPPSPQYLAAQRIRAGKSAA